METLDTVQRAIINGSNQKSDDEKMTTSFVMAPWRAIARFWESRGLPAKLIILTAAFVLLAEALIFLPSIASYRVTWLQERLTAAQLAALTSDAFPGGQIPSALRADLLRTAASAGPSHRAAQGERRLVFPPDGDLTSTTSTTCRPNRTSSGKASRRGSSRRRMQWRHFFRPIEPSASSATAGRTTTDLIEIVIPEAPLKAAMMRYGMNILWLSIISLAADRGRRLFRAEPAVREAADTDHDQHAAFLGKSRGSKPHHASHRPRR